MTRRRAPRRSIIESCNDPTPKEVYRATLGYWEAGLSFIPISSDLSKQPAFELLPQVWCDRRQDYRRTWSAFKSRQPTYQEIEEWFLPHRYGNEYGMAIVAGKVSGNLEILDLDTYDLIDPFKREAERRAPGLLSRLVRVKTPRPGLHLYYRCGEIGGNQKLARIQDPKSETPKPKTIIETKGEGGYCLAPPSPRWCHPRQECYIFDGERDLTQVPTITPDERQALFEAARTLDSWRQARPPRQRPRRKRPATKRGSLRPGDDFNVRADWADILQPHGWTYDGPGDDGTDRWARPGKDEGCSATTNYGDSDLLYVFSTNAEPFEEEECYTKFHAFALLEHDGDFHEAAVELRRRGYGKATRPARRGRSKRRRTRSHRSRRRSR